MPNKAMKPPPPGSEERRGLRVPLPKRQPKAGRWQVVKVMLAAAHSVGVIFTAIQIIGLWSYLSGPGPRDPDAGLGVAVQGIAAGVLGLPWSIGVFIVFADSPPAAGESAGAHSWVPILMLLLAVAVNSGLLWWWAMRRPAVRRGP